MPSTSKKIVKIISAFTIVLSLLPYFVLAQTSAPSNSPSSSLDETGSGSCSVCWATPKKVDEFIDFITALLAELPTRYSEWWRAGQYRVNGPWQWWVYGSIMNNTSDSPNVYTSIVAGTLRNLDQTQSTARTTSVLLGIYGRDIVVDGALGLMTTFQPRPIMRDYQRLLDVDTIISDKIYEMGIAGWFDRRLSSETLLEIKALFDKQTGSGQLFNKTVIQDDATIANLLKISMSINKRHKTTVSLWKNIQSGNISRWGIFDLNFNAEDNIVVYTNDSYRADVQESYACARIWTGKSNMCSSDFKSFSKAIKNIVQSSLSWGKESINKITTASKRLQTIFSQEKGNNESDEDFQKRMTDFEQRESELLGIQWVKRQWWWLLTGIVWWNVPRSIANLAKPGWGKALANSFKRSLEWVKTFVNDTFTREVVSLISDTVQKKREDDPWLQEVITKRWEELTNKKQDINQQQLNIANNLSLLILDHVDQIKSNSIASTDDSRQRLAQTLANIRLLNTLIYNPNSKETIYETLARTCELQCSNLWWTCRL